MLYLNGTPLEVTRFPDGTSQVWKLPKEFFKEKEALIKWEFSNEGEFLHLVQLKRLLNEEGISVSLEMTYLPYGRQDKEVSNDATFALHSFANLLNHLNFYEVICHDPHSDVAARLIKWFKPVYPTAQVDHVMKLTQSDLVCYPDRGALLKYGGIREPVYNYYHIYGEKVRDQSSGYITDYQLIGDPKDKKVLVIDDICDGGMTFILLSQKLLAAGAKEVNLFVTHGIFSKGLRVLKDAGIKRIFTKDGEATTYQNQIMYRSIL